MEEDTHAASGEVEVMMPDKVDTAEFEDKTSQLESSLGNSYARNTELQKKIKDLADRCGEHEGRASTSNQHSLELEGLIQTSHSIAENAGKKAGELEQLLEGANYRTQELDQLLSNAEAKCKDAESDSKQHCNKASELSTELEAFQTKSVSLETVLQAANEKEELVYMSNIVTEERNKFKDISAGRPLKTENLIELLQNDLKSTQKKLESVEKDLEASVFKEKDLVQKLKASEEQLEHHKREVEQAHQRSLELETLHESSVKESELKIQEAAVSFTQKESEAIRLNERLKSLEEEATFYQTQANEAVEKVAELIAHQSRISNLHDLLSSIQAEKEVTAEHLALHMNMLTKLSDEHLRVIELQSATEIRIKETEGQLHGAIEKFMQRDSEARELNEKLLSREAQLKIYEEQANEMTSIAENRKIQLEETLLKLQKLVGTVDELQNKVTQLEAENQGLASANLNLSQELATSQTKLNDLQLSLNAVIVENENATVELHDSRKRVEDLMQQLISDGQKLQSQKELISRKELETDASMKQSLGELEAEHKRANFLEKQVEELNEKLRSAEKQYKQKDIAGGNKLGLVNAELDDLRHKQSQTVGLEKKVAELENELMLNSKSGEKINDGAVEAELKDGLEVKSRDFHSGASSSKRKNKKKNKKAHRTADTPVNPLVTITEEHAAPMAFKFILVIALVSIVFGAFIGKRY